MYAAPGVFAVTLMLPVCVVGETVGLLPPPPDGGLLVGGGVGEGPVEGGATGVMVVVGVGVGVGVGFVGVGVGEGGVYEVEFWLTFI